MYVGATIAISCTSCYSLSPTHSPKFVLHNVTYCQIGYYQAWCAFSTGNPFQGRRFISVEKGNQVTRCHHSNHQMGAEALAQLWLWLHFCKADADTEKQTWCASELKANEKNRRHVAEDVWACALFRGTFFCFCSKYIRDTTCKTLLLSI